MFAALIGFGGFVAAVTFLSIVIYLKADSLEDWAKRHFKHSSATN